MSRIRNSLTAKERLAWYLLMVIVLLVALLAHAHYRLINVQTRFELYVPPIPSDKHSIMRPGEVPHSAVYLYSYTIWQQLNEWLTNGVDDYKKQITDLECYVSPDFFRWLNEDYMTRRQQNELRRKRHVSPIGIYTDEYVRLLANNTWYVWIDMALEERVAGEVVKTTKIRYPLYAYRDYRSCNVYGISLGGFFEEPSRIGEE